MEQNPYESPKGLGVEPFAEVNEPDASDLNRIILLALVSSGVMAGLAILLVELVMRLARL